MDRETYFRNRDNGVRRDTLADHIGPDLEREYDAAYRVYVRKWLRSDAVTEALLRIRTGAC